MASRIFHETRGMEGADGFVVGDAGRDDLATAGPAGHEMRLDQAGRDAQIGFDEAAIELDRRSALRGDAEIDVIGVVARIVVLDSNPRHDPGVAHQFGKFFANVWPMQAGRDQNNDAVERNARGDQGFDDRPQEEMVGHGPRDVANQDAGAFAPTGEFNQRRGMGRLRQRASNRRCGIDDLVELSLGDHGDFRFGGHAQRKMAAAVGNGDRVSHVGALVFIGQSLSTLIGRAAPICQFQRRAASCQKKSAGRTTATAVLRRPRPWNNLAGCALKARLSYSGRSEGAGRFEFGDFFGHSSRSARRLVRRHVRRRPARRLPRILAARPIDDRVLEPWRRSRMPARAASR